MMLELKNIYKNYTQGKMDVPVLKDISLSVDEGEYVAIMGPSGSGKTTLMNIIGCLDSPTSGEYILEGKDISQSSDNKLSDVRLHSIGFVFQSFYLLSRQSALENVALPLLYAGVRRKERLEIARKALERVGLGDRVNFKPTQLSGGQCQRVAIARAIVNNPKVLLADEPTGALDTKSGEQIMEIFQKLNEEGVTIVMITHEMAVVKEICDHVAIMEHGQVVEQGEVFSLFADPKQPITQNFIRTTSNLQKIEELIAEGSPVVQLQPGEVIVRLSYIQKNVSEPLISTLSQRFQISLNIIFADIEIVQDAPIGGTVAILSGEREQITKAMEYLIEKNVGVEVLKDARVTH